MKKCVLLLMLLACICTVNAQTGLIAHWNMDSSANDVSGHGHNGIANNVTAAVGKDGIMGHAYYFNGVNSYIYIPYTPDMNMSTGFSICAVVKVMGYNANTCHANMIFGRGQLSPIGTGTYALYMSDLGAGIGCSDPIDPTQECFLGGACATTAGLGPASNYQFNYVPHVQSDKWYNLALTFNDTAYKLYVNDTLMSIVYITTPGVHIGTSTNGASIGYDTYDSIGGYPYPFNGVIDDIKIFNRPLNESEIIHSTTAIHNLIGNPTIAMYPNPAHNELTIENAADSKAVITNMVGQLVSETSVTSPQQTINIASLISGTYIIQFLAPDGTRTSMHFVKQ